MPRQHGVQCCLTCDDAQVVHTAVSSAAGLLCCVPLAQPLELQVASTLYTARVSPHSGTSLAGSVGWCVVAYVWVCVGCVWLCVGVSLPVVYLWGAGNLSPRACRTPQGHCTCMQAQAGMWRVHQLFFVCNWHLHARTFVFHPSSARVVEAAGLVPCNTSCVLLLTKTGVEPFDLHLWSHGLHRGALVQESNDTHTPCWGGSSNKCHTKSRMSPKHVQQPASYISPPNPPDPK